ncbi:hypothetical protein D8M04_04640 [Oceanobacillus piezotolerans]|uniref:Uncharacterized protein n=1 Tax=Oceanobacillus piezotolerans TaxID=2448030 RepID=A0A498DPC9_9BACI|nr:hypothetical protein D8M04_04640 [Oceanobacillus piezotolerans]
MDRLWTSLETSGITWNYVLVISAAGSTLSAGNASASGQQDVGHKGVATGRGVLSLCSLPLPAGSSAVAFPAGVDSPPLQ